MDYKGGMKVWEGGVVWKSRGVAYNTQVAWKSHQWNDQQHDHHAHQLDQVNHDLAYHLSLDLGSAAS